MKVDNGSLFDDLMLIQDFARPTIDVQKGGRDMIWMGNMDENLVDSTMDDCVEIRQWMDGKKFRNGTNSMLLLAQKLSMPTSPKILPNQ